MSTVIEIILIPVAAIVTLTIYSVTLLPLIYGIPRSIIWAMRGQSRWILPLRYLVIELFWIILWLGVLLSLVHFAPSIWTFIYGSWGCWFGSWIGLFGFVGRLLTKGGRNDLNEDFISTAQKFQRI